MASSGGGPTPFGANAQQQQAHAIPPEGPGSLVPHNSVHPHHAHGQAPRKLGLKNLPSLRDAWTPGPIPCNEEGLVLSIVVLGASGDLAKKKTYPALFALHSKGFLPQKLQIIGYARSEMTAEQLQERLRPYLKGDASKIQAFLDSCIYVQGEYTGASGYGKLQQRLLDWETGPASAAPTNCRRHVGRLYYLALPPSVYPEVCEGLKQYAGKLSPVAASNSWLRVILEKPFGKDLESSEALATHIGNWWSEENLWRIDHYLGKELVQNMLVLRFANTIFGSWWNRHYIANVQITFKEPFGTEGRGGYFDSFGIIRDVIQNHLAQVFALLTMEAPVSLHPDDIRDEKVKLLRCVLPARVEDCVLGQYTAGNGQPGYLEDPTVPKNSRTPTFAAIKLHIRNDRWAGVPFIIKAGKALDDRLVIVRMQLKTPAASLFGTMHHMRNEFVMRFQPGEAIYTKLVVKKPGLDMDLIMSELDLTYPERFADASIPDAYERLILDCIRGDQQHFVRRDELRAAWAIFTPLLHAIDKGQGPPLHPYVAGTRGPAAADLMVADAGYTKTQGYEWRPQKSSDESPSTSATSTPRSAQAAAMAGKPQAAL